MPLDPNYTSGPVAIEQGQLGSETMSAGGHSSMTLPLATRIQIISDARFSVITNDMDADPTGLVDSIIPTGTVLYGRFTSLTIDEGLAVVYA